MYSRTVLVDLDSTLCDTQHRHHLTPRANPELTWIDYSMACLDDPPILGTVALVQMLSRAFYNIWIVSGRSIVALDRTESWLNLHQIPYDGIILRPEDDHTDNAVFKCNAAAQLRNEGHEIALAIDDWPPCKYAYAEIGIPMVTINACYEYSDRESEPAGANFEPDHGSHRLL